MRVKASAPLRLHLAERLLAQWSALSLSARFALAAAAIVGVSMLLLGQWLANRIESGVVQAEAAAAALYTDGFIEPHVQELTHGTSISPRKAQLLDELLSPKTIGKPIVGFRIWQGNTIVHSNRSELIGRTFPPSARRDKAWQGHVASYYQAHGSEDYRTDEAPKRPILEIYAPVRETGAQRIIALAETYEIVSTLPEALSAARREGWIIVVSAGIAVLALLSGIVEKGSQAIEASKTALNAQVSELSRLLAENNRLQQRVLLVGTRSADHIRASGHSRRTQRPDTWLHPNASLNRKIPLAPRAPSIHGPLRRAADGRSLATAIMDTVSRDLADPACV
jgi:hypothetical protein